MTITTIIKKIQNLFKKPVKKEWDFKKELEDSNKKYKNILLRLAEKEKEFELKDIDYNVRKTHLDFDKTKEGKKLKKELEKNIAEK